MQGHENSKSAKDETDTFIGRKKTREEMSELVEDAHYDDSELFFVDDCAALEADPMHPHPCVELFSRKRFGCSLALLLVLSLGAGDVAASPDEGSPEPATAPSDSGFVHFAVTSVSYLAGANWDTPFSPSRFRDIVTIEHFHDNRIGDVFFFVDGANLATNGRGSPKTGLDVYGELSVRLSLAKLFGISAGPGIVGDLFPYSGTLELGHSGSLQNLNDTLGLQIDTTIFSHLHGVAIDLAIPHFRVASLNGYWRDNTDASGSTWQATAVWALPFQLASATFLLSGFADLAGPEGRLVYSFHTSSQLMIELQTKKGIVDSIQLGVEVDMWINEFGIEGQDDLVPQLIAKVLF